MTPADRSWRGSRRRKHPTGEIPMPKYVIQREYLLPVYQYLIIEAETFEEACAEAVGPEHDWDTSEEDYDGSQPTTIINAKVVPEGAIVGQHHDTVITML